MPLLKKEPFHFQKFNLLDITLQLVSLRWWWSNINDNRNVFVKMKTSLLMLMLLSVANSKKLCEPPENGLECHVSTYKDIKLQLESVERDGLRLLEESPMPCFCKKSICQEGSVPELAVNLTCEVLRIDGQCSKVGCLQCAKKKEKPGFAIRRMMDLCLFFHYEDEKRSLDTSLYRTDTRTENETKVTGNTSNKNVEVNQTIYPPDGVIYGPGSLHPNIPQPYSQSDTVKGDLMSKSPLMGR